MSSFLRQYAASTMGSILGRAPAYMVPFVLVAVGVSGHMADEILLLLALAWFYPLVVSNVFVDVFVNEIESRKLLINEKRWAIYAAVLAGAPFMVSLLIIEENNSWFKLGVGFSIYAASFFGLLCARRAAHGLAGGCEFRVGFFNVVRGLVLVAMVLSDSTLLSSVMFAAAFAELLRWWLLWKFTNVPCVQDTLDMPSGSGQLVAGALLVAIALYVQRWILAEGIGGSLLWFEIADKIYSLVAVGLTLGLAGVLQKYITRMVLADSKASIVSALRMGGGVGIAGAAICIVVVIAVQGIQKLGMGFSLIDMNVVYPLVVLMAIGFIPSSMTMVLSRVFVARNQARWVLLFSFLSALVVMPGSYIANLYWGVFGVVVVNVLNSVLIFSLFLARALRKE